MTASPTSSAPPPRSRPFTKSKTASRTSSTSIWRTASTSSRRSWTPAIWRLARRRSPSRGISSRPSGQPHRDERENRYDRTNHRASRRTDSRQGTQTARPDAQECSSVGDARPRRADGCNHVAHGREEGADRPEIERSDLPAARADRSKRSADCNPSEPDSGVAAGAANRNHSAEQILWLAPVRAAARRFRSGHGSRLPNPPPPDPVQEEKKRRAYVSLFSSNVALSYRKELAPSQQPSPNAQAQNEAPGLPNLQVQPPDMNQLAQILGQVPPPPPPAGVRQPPSSRAINSREIQRQRRKKTRTGNLFHFKLARRCDRQDLRSIRRHDPRNRSLESPRRRLCRSRRMPRYQRHLLA